jgi:hypothetical protein
MADAPAGSTLVLVDDGPYVLVPSGPAGRAPLAWTGST